LRSFTELIFKLIVRQTSYLFSPSEGQYDEDRRVFQTFGGAGTGDDPFSVTLKMSESDRQHDAWLPSDNTKNILITVATHSPGTFTPTEDMLVKPSLVIIQPQVSH